MPLSDATIKALLPTASEAPKLDNKTKEEKKPEKAKAPEPKTDTPAAAPAAAPGENTNADTPVHCAMKSQNRAIFGC